MAHSILVVARMDDAEHVGVNSSFEQHLFPHFHCSELDAGIFGQLFWLLSQDKVEFARTSEQVQVVCSHSSGVETVVVHVLPSRVVERYAKLSDQDLPLLASQWTQPNGYIRIPRSADFYEQLLGAVARLAGIAIERGEHLLVRTQFRGTYNQPFRPIGRTTRSG